MDNETKNVYMVVIFALIALTGVCNSPMCDEPPPPRVECDETAVEQYAAECLAHGDHRDHYVDGRWKATPERKVPGTIAKCCDKQARARYCREVEE